MPVALRHFGDGVAILIQMIRGDAINRSCRRLEHHGVSETIAGVGIIEWGFRICQSMADVTTPLGTW